MTDRSTHNGWLPDQWYPVLESRRLGRKPRGVTRLGERLVLWRDASGGAVAMLDRCAHRGVALSRGKIRDGLLECPYHGFRYDATGACRLMPCEGTDARIPDGMKVPRYAVREAHGLVWLYWGEAAQAHSEVPWFDQLPDDRPGGGAIAKDWPINFVRTLESNFDLHHGPFIHRAVFPGVGTRLDPYHVEVEGTHIRTRGTLRHEGKDSGMSFAIEFKMPSLTYFELTPKLCFLVADCPIDAHRTWRYARYYQDYLRVPGLHRFGSWLFLQVDWLIFQMPQDLRVMKTQQPRLPADHVDRLVHADGGTAAYTKLHRRLWAEAEARERQVEPGAAAPALGVVARGAV